MTGTIAPPLKWHGGKHYLARRIVALELAEDDLATAGVGRPRYALQTHQRRAADGVFEGLVGGHRFIVQHGGEGDGACDNPRPLRSAHRTHLAPVAESVDAVDSKSTA